MRSNSATSVFPAEVGAEYTRLSPSRTSPTPRHSACHSNIDWIPLLAYLANTVSGRPQKDI